MSESLLHDTPLWWLSFADPGRPEGSQFLGVLIVPGRDLAEAITFTHLAELNPGGEVVSMGPLPQSAIDRKYWRRLLGKDEAESLLEPEEG